MITPHLLSQKSHSSQFLIKVIACCILFIRQGRIPNRGAISSQDKGEILCLDQR